MTPQKNKTSVLKQSDGIEVNKGFNPNSSQTTAFNSKKTNVVTHKGYKENVHLLQNSIASSPTKYSNEFTKRSPSNSRPTFAQKVPYGKLILGDSFQ